jgi:hypothetical protein
MNCLAPKRVDPYTDGSGNSNPVTELLAAARTGIRVIKPGERIKEMKMSKASYPLKLPASLKNAAQRLAKQDGVSLNQWISVAVAQKIGAVETAADFFKRRAGHAKPEDMLSYLREAKDESVTEDDKN